MERFKGIGLFFGGYHITRKAGLTKDALKNNEFIIFVDSIEDMECKYPDANVMAREYIFCFKNFKKNIMFNMVIIMLQILVMNIMWFL